MEDTVNRTCVHCQDVVGFTVGDDGFFYCDYCGFQADDIFDTGVSEENLFTNYAVNRTRFQLGSTITDGDFSDCDSCCSQADDIVDTAVSVPCQMHQTNRSSARSNKQSDITSDKSSELKRSDASLLNSSPHMPSNSQNSSDNSLAAMIKSISQKRELNQTSSSHHNKAPEENQRHMKGSS